MDNRELEITIKANSLGRGSITINGHSVNMYCKEDCNAGHFITEVNTIPERDSAAGVIMEEIDGSRIVDAFLRFTNNTHSNVGIWDKQDDEYLLDDIYRAF